MATKTWTLNLEDGSHTVELEHGTVSGKRAIRLDGSLIEESQQVVDFGSRHPFEIGGHQAVVLVKTNGITFSYDLVLDGRSVETGTPVQLRETGIPLPVATATASAPAAAAAPAPEVKVTFLPPEDPAVAMRKQTRSWGESLLVLGAVHLVASGLLSGAWGVTLLLVGLASFVFPDPAMLIVYAVTLAWAAIGNLTGGVAWFAFALLQFYLAARVAWSYRLFRRARMAWETDGSGAPAGRTARVFPWLGCLLPAVAAIGAVAVLLFVIVVGPDPVPPAADLAFEAALNLGILGFAVSLASLLSRFRYRALAILGLVAGGLVLAADVALQFA